MLPSEERPPGGARRRPRLLRHLGRSVAFRLDPADDPVFDRRLVLTGTLPGWIVLTYSADATAPPFRPFLRILRRAGPAQDAVLPGPALGRARWLGLIPDDATDILLSLGPDTRLERVGRRSALGVLAECFARRPGHALAAIYEGARGRARRSRDILRGGVAVMPVRRFTAWAEDRTVAFAGGGQDTTVACLVLAGPGDEAGLARTLAALSRQTLAPETIKIAREGSPQGAESSDNLCWDPDCHPASLSTGADALCLLQAGDALEPDALALMATHLGGADLVYADAIGPDGVPSLKPDWSPDLALATGYVGRPALVSQRLLERLPSGGLGSLADAPVALEASVAAACRRAVHIPRPLARTAPHRPRTDRTAILRDRLAMAGLPVTVRDREGVTDLLWPLPDPAPLVSVIIPSRDRIDLIRPVCRGVLTATNYPALELIVVDNGSTDPAVLAFYDELRRDPRTRIVPFPHPFNFAAMVNAGVDVASGEVVVLLNNDIAVRGPNWLEEMVRQAIRPEVGAVGAKLLFGDGTLQHAGVVVGLGGRAGHILRRRKAGTPGHLGRLRVAHEVSAVTAACLAVATRKYRSVGGFDAEAFPVDFNDVDFCLRLQAKGWKCVWTPAATLSHFESVSRGPSVGAKRDRFEAEAARFVARWGNVIRHDPYYHPALSLTTFGEDLE
jgi:GT2 family glycosyltransferase